MVAADAFVDDRIKDASRVDLIVCYGHDMVSLEIVEEVCLFLSGAYCGKLNKIIWLEGDGFQPLRNGKEHEYIEKMTPCVNKKILILVFGKKYYKLKE